jgi:hypothetical protein
VSAVRAHVDESLKLLGGGDAADGPVRRARGVGVGAMLLAYSPYCRARPAPARCMLF